MKNLILVILPLLFAACGPKTETVEVEVFDPERGGIGYQEITVTETEDPWAAATFTMEEIAKHADKESCYSAIDGKVYDLTAWMDKHPGGAGNILKICGKDGTEAFSGKHEGSAQAKATLPNYLIGELGII
ncbi:cytochrome b5 domain-containing protein [Candidatus Gracilibacteria bacterium]|nr:cytochrome b5 domain-containing protein [Candidatus Gracilibacteria bacterium]